MKSLLILMLAGLFVAFTMPVTGATGDPVLINEVLASHTGTDDTEYIELFGVPGTSLDGLSLIVVESSNISTLGDFDEILDFGPGDILGSNGFYLIGAADGLQRNYSVMPNIDVDLNLENNSLTVALVESSSVSSGSVSRVLTNLIDSLTDDNVYTFNFEGNSQVLDHFFVNDALLHGAEFDIVHVNVDFPRVDDTIGSDHEPLVGRLKIK